MNVKSKTTDGLGFTGTGDGMSAYCVVMLSLGPGIRDLNPQTLPPGP